jgi:hypothetical protein
MSYAQPLATLFCEQLSAAETGFAAVHVAPDFSASEKTLPAIVVKVETQPLNADYTNFEWTLTAHVETSADIADPEAAHSALVQLLRGQLHGSGRDDLRDACNAPGDFELRAWAAIEAPPGIEGFRFRTPLAITGVGFVL